MGKVTVLRRVSQITFFFLIVYLGVIGIQGLGMVFQTSEADVLESQNVLTAFMSL